MSPYELELASILQQILGPFARANRLGRAFAHMLYDLRPAVNRSRRPDVSFLSAERRPLDHRAPLGGRDAWPIVPDLAVEIVSRTNSASHVMEKVEEYFLAGSRRVWVVYPVQAKIYLYESPTSVRILARDQSLSDEAILPGFQLALGELFGNPAD